MAVRARRLFFALWPDPPIREALVHATRKAVRHCGGRPVPQDNLHATLAFLGPVAEASLETVLAGGSAAAREGRPFALRVEDLDFWPKPQVLVATAATPPEAEALAERLWRAVEPLGIPRDPRPLRLHVTLARKVRTPAPGLAVHPVDWAVASLALVESVTDPAGARYTPLAQWPLEASGAGVTP
ncbi:MAG: RNA 2',3'-cyclic phosphodiesterase [Steroidobacteraceae bacterium]|nr:RNA 2',3'-cyclic phosphodiesterase [Steroidobacteraceae bacterium]